MLIRSNRIFGIVTLAFKPSLRASARQNEDTFILGILSWAITNKSHLEQIFVFGLGHMPNIRVENELLGPKTLQ